jgi:hypothetical protein
MSRPTSTSTTNFGRRGGLHDAADYDVVGEHVEVVIVPLAGRAARRRALEDRRSHGARLTAWQESERFSLQAN